MKKKFADDMKTKGVLKAKFLIFALLMSSLAAAGAAHAQIPAQNLIKGQSVTLNVEYKIGDVAITNDRVCDYLVRDSRQEIYLNPRSEGDTRMTVWDKSGEKRDEFAIHVEDITIDSIYNQAKERFGDVKDIKIEVKNGWLILSGTVDSRHQHRQIQEFAQKYPQVENGVHLSPAVIETLVRQIEKEIAIPGVEVRQVRSQLLIEGLVYSDEAYKKADTIARIYVPDVVNLLEVRKTGRRPGKDRLVQIDVHLMEIKKSALRSMGISWTPGVSSSSSYEIAKSQSDLSGLVGTLTSIFPKINFIRQSGGGRVLENPKFLVKSGESADFFSGQTIPYRSERTVEFQNAGIRVKASPIATAGDVDLQVEVELSALAPNSDNIDRNTFNTTVYLPAGRSAVLGGLISNRDTKMWNKAPGGAESAIIALAASKDFQSNRSEFYIFLTPNILHDTLPAERQLSDYLETQEDMIRDRSKKEYREYMVNFKD